MGVKWDDVHIRTGTLTGEIYVGKMKKDKHGLDLFSDKSKPITKECVKAVMEHMLSLCEKGDNEEISFTVEGICKLSLIDLRIK